MIGVVPQSGILISVISVAMHLKWAWDYLLCQVFFQHSNFSCASFVPENHVDDFNVARYEDVADGSSGTAECAVCLCKIDKDDEVRELRCDHLFHRVCLDRWLGYGSMTCPVCRNRLKLPAMELHRELVVIDFCATGYGGRERWWLR